MVEAIVKQRDMYRVLLAQSTPLPDPPQVREHMGLGGIVMTTGT